MDQKIQNVEAGISKAEVKAEKAEAEGNTEDLKYWRNEKQKLRDEKQLLMEEKKQLRDEKARKEVLQQGTLFCSPLKHHCIRLGRSSSSKTFRPGSIMMSASSQTSSDAMGKVDRECFFHVYTSLCC